MGVKNFRFVSPGIQINEIDNSQLPKVSEPVGPIIIGRAERGPGLRPVTVSSFSDWVEMFGNPVAGGLGGDVWREGNKTAPMYGTYAAQAWLRNSTPLTYVRLMGASHTDASATGKAGWETQDRDGNFNGIGTNDTKGGAYGLFLINSSSADTLTKDPNPQTGSLAAIWYFDEGSITLSGSVRGHNTITTSGSAVLIKSVGPYKEFKCNLLDKDSNVVKSTTFNFNRNSQKYIRKVFNTNPILTNEQVIQGASTASYWLGQSYERFVDTHVTGGAGEVYGMILGLKGDAGTKEGSDYRFSTQNAQTGWIFGQDLDVVSSSTNNYQPSLMQKLFRFHGLDNSGEWLQKNIKISIQDVRASSNQSDPYGTFTIVLRNAKDSDNAVRIIERYTGCNLNPVSINYVAKKIGDRYTTWDDTERRYREYGNYDNASRFVRIEMDKDVDAGAVPSELLPFGFYGPLRHVGFAVIGQEDNAQSYGASSGSSDFTAVHAQGNANIVRSKADSGTFVSSSYRATSDSFTGSFLFPSLALRSSSIQGDLPNPQDAYFGIDMGLSSTSNRPDPGYGDYLYPLADAYNAFTPNSAGETEYSFIFTLDDISGSNGAHAIYNSGSRAAGTSLTATSENNYKNVLDQGFNRFTLPLWGGFDGLDIKEKEPFNNTDLEDGTETTNYAYNSVKRAIDSVSDPEVIECNLMTIPGITNENLTSHLITVCEDRADAMAIIDLKGGFIPSTENTSGDDAAANRGDVDTAISNLKARSINTSYGCAYYPWVQIRDNINGATLWAPPSIVALGTMAHSERKSEVWFAPAGFNRGGLTEGSSGIPVIGIKEKLTSKERDKLYEANINPIASFPSEGIVIFGQKTLQTTQSALDRINVRRLMIFVKKEISRIASRTLFEPNTRVTINRLKGKIEPFLRDVQIRFGLDDFKLVIDETNNPPELKDRNAIYGQLYLKPTRAIEHILIDAVISDSGASFNDE